MPLTTEILQMCESTALEFILKICKIPGKGQVSCLSQPSNHSNTVQLNEGSKIKAINKHVSIDLTIDNENRCSQE